MQSIIDQILAIEPDVAPLDNGTWLARAPEDAPVRLGAIETTAEAATTEFCNAVARLVAALESTVR